MTMEGVCHSNTGADGEKWRSECAGNERQPRYFKHTMETAIREESWWQTFFEASYTLLGS